MNRRQGDPSDAGEAGSAFIEAVVALALLAAILGSVYQIGAASAARHRAVEARRDALMVARSVLATVGATAPLAVGSSQGADDGQAWRIDTERCGAADSATGLLYCVTVSVGRPGGPPLVSLLSRRLGPLT